MADQKNWELNTFIFWKKFYISNLYYINIKMLYWSYLSPNHLTQVGIFLLKTVFVTSRKRIQDNLRPCFMQMDRLNTGLKCYCFLAFKSVNHQSEILFNWLSSLQGRMWGFNLYYLNTDTVQKLLIMFIVYTATLVFPSPNLINSVLSWIQKINIQIFNINWSYDTHMSLLVMHTNFHSMVF